MARKRADIFRSIESLYLFYSHFVGVDVTRQGSPLKLLSVQILIIDIVVVAVCNVYSIIKFHDDLIPLVFSLVVIGFFLSGIAAFFTTVWHKDSLHMIYGSIKEYYCGPAGTRRQAAIKDKYVKMTFDVSLLFSVVYSLSGFAVLMCTVALNVVTSQSRALLFGFILPFVDVDSKGGFLVTFTFQALQIFVAVSGFVAFQVLYNVIVFHCYCQLEILTAELEPEWGFQTADNEKRLRDIFRLHQTQLESLADMEALFDLFNTTQLICTVFQVALTAFILLFENWIQGYFVFFLAVVVFLLNCVYGTIVQVKSMELEQAVFNTLQWSHLKPLQRRMVAFMLQMVQERQTIKCGRIFVLGFRSFVVVG